MDELRTGDRAIVVLIDEDGREVTFPAVVIHTEDDVHLVHRDDMIQADRRHFPKGNVLEFRGRRQAS